MNEISKITNHVPEAIKKNNPNLENFLEVIQGMQDVKAAEVEEYARRFYYPLLTDIRVMKRYVDEWAAEYTESSTRLCIDCLYRQFWGIYSRKGTTTGLENLLECLMMVDQPVDIVVGDFVRGKPLILFDDWRPNDWLPEGADIAAELLAAPGEERWCPTLLDDTWADTKATLGITCTLNYTPTATFIDFIKKLIPLYCPMVTSDTLIITLNI